ncbi:hypothetical protein EJB05_09503, partial [Eragrostis curvula]
MAWWSVVAGGSKKKEGGIDIKIARGQILDLKSIRRVNFEDHWEGGGHWEGGFPSVVVGESGFSTVYLGALAAVKVHRSSERLHRVFRQELDMLLRVRHPHIVLLVAFCDQQEEGILVLEFAVSGNLHEQLHGGGKAAGTIPWARRVSVALQVARALEYLHDRCEPHVVHGDVKASNVLLGAPLSGGGRARQSLQGKRRRRGKGARCVEAHLGG